MPRLADKVAVITGATTGIGFATAQLFVAEGATVVVTGQDPARLEAARQQLGHKALCLLADVRSAAALKSTFADINDRFGGVDVLFANAGVVYPVPFEQVTEANYDEQMNVNARGVFFTVQAASPHLKEGASVILNASINARIGMPRVAVYSASKAAVRSFARTLAADLAPRGIRVNAISPGPVDTPAKEKSQVPPEVLNRRLEEIHSQVPMQRVSAPEEIARVVLFLASSDSSYMLGADVVVDGGLTML
jgi:NAD(P)-dependent dehydrogenase (short-subunit alcohol dehydrogenase family)